MKAAILSKRHYASKWAEISILTLEEANELGRLYSELPDGPAKQAAFLKIAAHFHGYLMKYLRMIFDGRVPSWGPRVNKDVEPFIKFFLPKSEPVTRAALTTVCRHFHLAVKGMDTDEVYEVLMIQLLTAIARYDPAYTEKVKLLTEAINTLISNGPTKQFNVSDFGDHPDFDATAICVCWHVITLSNRSWKTDSQRDGSFNPGTGPLRKASTGRDLSDLPITYRRGSATSYSSIVVTECRSLNPKKEFILWKVFKEMTIVADAIMRSAHVAEARKSSPPIRLLLFRMPGWRGIATWLRR